MPFLCKNIGSDDYCKRSRGKNKSNTFIFNFLIKLLLHAKSIVESENHPVVYGDTGHLLLFLN